MSAASATRNASLSVPGVASMLSTVRVFVTRFAEGDLDDERIDDLRIAVDEACARTEGATLTISIAIDNDRCSITCEGVSAPSVPDDDVRLQLLEALARDVEWSDDASVRFAVPTRS